MGGPLLIVLALSSPGWADDCGSVLDHVEDAERALLLMDVGTARAELDAAEAAFGCDWVTDPELLGRFWLIEGALMTFEGEADGAPDSFRAAHRVAPTLWLVDLGPELLSAYEAAAAADPGTGRIEAKDLDPGYVVRIDGADADSDVVEAGIHLVQIGTQKLRFAQVVFVLPNRTSMLEPELPDLPRRSAVSDVGPPDVDEDPTGARAIAHVAVGVAGAAGEAVTRRTIDGAVADEPATKVRVPVEVGLGVRAPALWARGTAGLGPMVGGRLLFEADDGVHATGLTVQSGVAGGVTLGALDVGAHFGLLLPSRFAAGVVVAVELASDWAVEARVGTDIHPVRAPEPALALLATWRPELSW